MDQKDRGDRSEMKAAVVSAFALGAFAGISTAIPSLPRPKHLQAHIDEAERLRKEIIRQGAVRPGRRADRRGSMEIDPYEIAITKLSPKTKSDLQAFWREQKRLKPEFRRYWRRQGRRLIGGALLGGIGGASIAVTAFAASDLARRRREGRKKRKGRKRRKK